MLEGEMFNSQQDRLRGEIDALAARHGTSRQSLIPILQDVQKRYHTISDFAMQTIADRLGIPPVDVYGVVTFYPLLNEKYHGRFVIRLCRTIGCDMAGKLAVAQQLRNDLGIDFGETTPDGRFTLEWANCIGMCDQGPALTVNDEVFTRVTPARVSEVLDWCVTSLGMPAGSGVGEPHWALNLRTRMSLDAVAPQAGLRNALAMAPEGILELIGQAGIRGRGGAGFPMAVKWRAAASTKAERKYVVCNAAEGEPGTFKDRAILTRWPDLVFEGMTIAGYAVGAQKGILYLRGKYSSLRDPLEAVLAERRRAGLLGADLMGKRGFTFDIQVYLGCGTYVCGEETALIESLEGRRGEVRNRPPFPVSSGLDGMPTVVNNVETLALAAATLANGAQWFLSEGTAKTPGIKLLSVSGDVARPGVYEFPMGVTVSEVLEAAGGQDAKAVMVGGASGQCLPRAEFSRRICYEDTATSGAFLVFGPHRDLLSVAENFLEFFVNESCGQCAPCRIGTIKLLEGVRMLQRGECSSGYLKELCALGETMRASSKCGLGQLSPNAFMSIVRHFRGEVLGRPRADAASTQRRPV
jgi:[NiFe] hydrogenase diaphorase moiety large subunit